MIIQDGSRPGGSIYHKINNSNDYDHKKLPNPMTGYPMTEAIFKLWLIVNGQSKVYSL